VPLAAHEGTPLAQVPGLEASASAVQQRFDEFLNETQAASGWTTGSSRSSSMRPAARGAAGTHGHPGGARRRDARQPGSRLLVFDDISEIVSAQRAQAWGEVARRLAHEIKNPLTPIQLSAERLEMKLSGKLAMPSRRS
jgi:nitrogen fixation/metabolism regulation signal transduction histidine kinase